VAFVGWVASSVAWSQTNPTGPSTGTNKFLLRGKLIGSTQANNYVCARCRTW
jgi:hypothetical protein